MTQFANFIYEYQRYSGYQPGDVNLGDYVQSIAARGFYPHVDLLLDRDGYTSTNIGNTQNACGAPPHRRCTKFNQIDRQRMVLPV